jgi:hypothetical protein
MAEQYRLVVNGFPATATLEELPDGRVALHFSGEAEVNLSDPGQREAARSLVAAKTGDSVKLTARLPSGRIVLRTKPLQSFSVVATKRVGIALRSVGRIRPRIRERSPRRSARRASCRARSPGRKPSDPEPPLARRRGGRR